MEHHNSLISNTINFVKHTLSGAEAGHDWFHAERVWKTTRAIAQKESCHVLVAELAALLHDVADAKFHNGDEEKGPAMARKFLTDQNTEEEIIEQVVNIIRNISFSGGNTTKEVHSRELAVVQDADRLDALGAIGIARTFHYGGHRNRLLYDPEIKPNMRMDKETYRNSTAPTINHFYEKLLLLKDRMNTETGKEMAKERHDYMVGFLEQFYREWEGESI